MKGEPVLEESVQCLGNLIEQARSGDRDAFDQLIKGFETTVMKTALYLTGKMSDAEDVAQEVYIKIFKHLPAFEGTREIHRWVYRVTVNEAHNLHRKTRLWGALKEIVRHASDRDPVVSYEIRNRLTAALARLSFNERAAFVFKELHELETKEVAEILGCRDVTVRAHLARAKRKLRNHLSDLR